MSVPPAPSPSAMAQRGPPPRTNGAPKANVCQFKLVLLGEQGHTHTRACVCMHTYRHTTHMHRHTHTPHTHTHTHIHRNTQRERDAH